MVNIFKKRSSLFWYVTQCRISYRRFGTTHCSHPQGSNSPRRNLLGLFDPKRQ